MTENEAKQMEVEIKWNGRANVCVHCGKVPETYYITTGHDHTDDSIRYCFCRSVAPSIEHLQAKIAELEEENARLKSLATTKGAMGLLADQLKQLAAAQEEIQKLRQDLLISYGESEELSDTAKSFADALRRGEWRKFVKGE